MSLNWDITKVKDCEKVCFRVVEKDEPENSLKKGEKVLSKVTDAIIWGTMLVDIGEVTEKNLEEWVYRLAVMNSTRKLEMGITVEDLRAHIGLHTNVSTETRNVFWKKIRRIVDREVFGEVSKAMKGLKDEDEK